MFIVRSKSALISSTFTTMAQRRRRVPSKYKSLAIEKAQQAITDYLRTTRSLSYTHAEQIATNASISIRNLILKIDFSVPNFSRSLSKYLSYYPINEFEFFFESIGIDYSEVEEYLPEKKFFFSEDRCVLDVACALSGFGFPWNKLGKLYKEERLVFTQSQEEINSRLVKLKEIGFNTVEVIGICLAIPNALCRVDWCLFVKLKRLFQEFDFDEENIDSWCVITRKIKVFYDLVGLENEEMWELMCRNKSVLMEYSEEDLRKKIEYFVKFGVGKEADAALLILKHGDVIMKFDLEKMISVRGILKHFGLSDEEVNQVAKKYPYVFGRNRLSNLPFVVRALNLHERIFNMLKNGNHHLLDTHSLLDSEDFDGEYQQGLKEIQESRTKQHNIQKLNFLHEIGFGENETTIKKVLRNLHGTALELQERFEILLNNGLEFSKICMLIRTSPKILNQKPESIQDKISFLCNEIGSLKDLEIFPAYLCFDLENRINPRFRFHKWLVEKKLSERSYSIASIVATSEKAFVARLYGIHPAIPKLWFECFSYRKHRDSV